MSPEEITLNSAYPGEQAIQCYLSELEKYRQSEQFFAKGGFSFPLAREILGVAELTVWDAYHLFVQGKQIPDGGSYLEIGSYCGGSLACVFLATQPAGLKVNFIAIEPFTRELVNSRDDLTLAKQFRKNTKAIPLRLLRLSSDMARCRIADGSVDLLFVDGDHSHGQVKRDLENYWPKLKENGVLLGHDYQACHPDVMQAADEVFGPEKNVLKNSSVFLVRKNGHG